MQALRFPLRFLPYASLRLPEIISDCAFVQPLSCEKLAVPVEKPVLPNKDAVKKVPQSAEIHHHAFKACPYCTRKLCTIAENTGFSTAKSASGDTNTI
jgi:hypothetical protein